MGNVKDEPQDEGASGSLSAILQALRVLIERQDDGECPMAKPLTYRFSQTVSVERRLNASEAGE